MEAFQQGRFQNFHNLATKETMVESPLKKIKWNKSDFTRLLPHPGEIPKYASKTVAEPSISISKKDAKAVSSKTYMTWLEELMSHKLGQDLSPNLTVPASSAPNREKPKGASAMLPRWATIPTTKKEDPVEKFKRTYEGFQKYGSSTEAASQIASKNNAQGNPNNNNEEMRSFVQPDPHLNKHVGFSPHPFQLSKDLESVSNTIRAILANSKNRHNPDARPTLSVAATHQKHLGIRFQETAPLEHSNVNATRKVPKMLFMQSPVDVNTLMNPKGVDQLGPESQMVVPPESSLRVVDTFRNYQNNLAASLSLNKKTMGSANNLDRQCSSKTQTIYTAPNATKRLLGGRTLTGRQFGESFIDEPKMLLHANVPKIKSPWNAGFTPQQQVPTAASNFQGSLEAHIRKIRDVSPMQRMSLSLPKYAHPTEPFAATYLMNQRDFPANAFSTGSAEIKK
jgi:hypothetical protein